MSPASIPRAPQAKRSPACAGAYATYRDSQPTTSPLGTHSARNTYRRGTDDQSSAFVRRVSRTEGRPGALGGRADRPNRVTAAATTYRAAPTSSVPRAETTATSAPPTANPQICIAPPVMLSTERPIRNPSRGTISLSSPYRTPPPADPAAPTTSSTAKAPHSGSPGTACTQAATADSRASALSVARGGSRSAAESSVSAPAAWASDGPNIASADSRGEPVRVYTRVPSARPVAVWAAVWTETAVKKGVNSGVRNSSR